jgi:lactoylglutathione lyase
MIRSAHHTGLQVADLDRSLAYYVDLLGFEVEQQWEVAAPYVAELVGYPNVRIRVAMLRLPGTDDRLEIVEYNDVPKRAVDTSTANPGTAHVCLLVDDVGALYERLVEGGHATVSPPIGPTEGPNVGQVMMYAIDPDGIRLEIKAAAAPASA